MYAQVIHEFGAATIFQQEEVERPTIKAGHILIKVAATSINPVDYKIRRNGPPIAPALPAILHGDVAGIVEEVGEGVVEFSVGDEVYACAGGVRGLGGALADFMLADAALVAHKPRSLTMREAAALPLVTITAWEGLIDRTRIEPGQTVLVHGATGGVGHIAIQIAKNAGAIVYATGSSEEKLAIARDLGADYAINYREQSVKQYVDEYTGGKGFDVVFDTVGGKNLDASLEAVRLSGTVISISTSSMHDLTPMHKKNLTLSVVYMLLPMLTNTGRARHGEILRQVATLVDAGRLRPLIDEPRWTFDDVAKAHERAESGDAIGKVVLER